MTESGAVVGTLYTLWQTDEGSFSCSPEDAPVVDRAMKMWAESRRDSWISVHGPTGAEFSVLASSITSTTMATASVRAESSVLDKAIDDERLENRRAAGFIESA